MVSLIRKILKLFNKKEKKLLFLLFFMMVIAALLEMVGIGLIVPFASIVTNPDIINQQPVLKFLYELFNFESTMNFTLFCVVLLLSVFVIKNLYLLLFNHMQYKVILNQQVKLSRRLFAEYLTKPYIFHLQRNTADLLRNVNGEVPRVFQGIIMAGFQLITESLVISCILLLLILTSPVATTVAAILLGGSVLMFFKFFRKKTNSIGSEQQSLSGMMIKAVNQGLGASKEVKVLGKEGYFVNEYYNQSRRYVNNSRYIMMLEQAPRLFLETMLVSIILVTMVIILIQDTNTNEIVSTMALFAMSAFRLMPSINRVMAMVTTIRFNQHALSVVYEDIFEGQNQCPSSIKESDSGLIMEGIYFRDSINLCNVSFRYPGQKEYSIKDISLTIPIGHSVAFVGESGAGKTTLVDIILGLFVPEKGSVQIDGKSLWDQKCLWQKKIGYIPQSIFLSDDTIRHNVAFGIDKEKISDEEVWRALDQAQLKDYVMNLPEKLDTTVGERGVRLSGGQRQRIGIARALYHDPEILFMDEATSALDGETEKEIIKAIDGLKGAKTLIIIAHRLSTIENCDTVFKINNGRLISINNKLVQSS